MKCDKKNMLLYAVTDRAWVGKQTLCEQVEAALKGGCTCVQLREKELSDAEFLRKRLKYMRYASTTVYRLSSTTMWILPSNVTPREFT